MTMPAPCQGRVFAHPAPVADNELARRFFLAQQRQEHALGRRLPLEEIGGAVARVLGRSVPIAPSVVRRWLRGISEPDRLTLQALADIFDVSPGWLAFGEAEARRAMPADVAPAAPSTLVPPPSEAEMARARERLDAQLARDRAAEGQTHEPPARRGRRAGGKG